jgi:hypothetical protein
MTVTYRIHESTKEFDPLTSEEMRALTDDIKKNGWLIPLLVWKQWVKEEGKEIHWIMDGAHRYKVCMKLNKFFKVVVLECSLEEAIQKAKASNNIRRHRLTPAQKAILAAEMANAHAGRPLQTDNTSQNYPVLQENNTRQNYPVLQENNETGETAIPLKEAAKRVGASHGYAKVAKPIADNATPELRDAAYNGDIPLTVAAEIARQPEEQQQEAVRAARSGNGADTIPKKKKRQTSTDNGEPATLLTVLAKARKDFKALAKKYGFDFELEQDGPARDLNDDLVLMQEMAERAIS